MYLHDAIEKLLKEKGRAMTTEEIANELNHNKWYQKKDGSPITAYQIHGRTKNYPKNFDHQGATVSLKGGLSIASTKESNVNITQSSKNQKKKKNSDENYVLDLCDRILGMNSIRQHKFDFLIGDPNSQGYCARLPVDAYYAEINLVIEYKELQHSEDVKFFDKPNKLTVSGVHRGEQRRIYDQRRRQELPKHGIRLIEISYSDFNHDTLKRIIRNPAYDSIIIKNKLEQESKN